MSKRIFALMLFLSAPLYLYDNLTCFEVFIFGKKQRPILFFVVTHQTARLSIGGANDMLRIKVRANCSVPSRR